MDEENLSKNSEKAGNESNDTNFRIKNDGQIFDLKLTTETTSVQTVSEENLDEAKLNSCLNDNKVMTSPTILDKSKEFQIVKQSSLNHNFTSQKLQENKEASLQTSGITDQSNSQNNIGNGSFHKKEYFDKMEGFEKIPDDSTFKPRFFVFCFGYEEFSSDFDTIEDRHDYLRSYFFLIFLIASFSAGTICLFMFIAALAKFLNGFIAVIVIGVLTVVLVVGGLILYRYIESLTIKLLAVLIVIFGWCVMCGMVSVTWNTYIFLAAAIFIAATSMLLMFLAMQFSWDLTTWTFFLFTLAVIIIMVSLTLVIAYIIKGELVLWIIWAGITASLVLLIILFLVKYRMKSSKENDVIDLFEENCQCLVCC